MPLPDILLQFDHLDKDPSQFQDQLTGLLYKEEFKDCIPKLRDKDVVWLVEYLDKVRLFLYTCTLLTRSRLSIPVTLPVLHPGSAYVNSEVFVAPGGSCRLGT